ncbi:MAG TPA: hypothetical protein VMT63_10255 [Bacteroidales bacterium]|nr:hypothetical protein [Bacteroidales bacterium]
MGLTLLIPAGRLSCQEKNYREIFGENWNKAETFLSENKSWIKPALEKYDLGYEESVAVIFPELVRYSSVSDLAETALLKTLYVNLGKEYADFSVGYFQMKPSFGEKLGQSAVKLLGRRYYSLVRDSMDFGDKFEYRRAIIRDLEDEHSQLNYLIVFIRICSRKFSLGKMTAGERVKFLSSAYNYGFFHSESEILKMENRSFFATGIIKRDFYPYSDISLYWYHLHVAE